MAWKKGMGSPNPGGRPRRGRGTPKNYARGFLEGLGLDISGMDDDEIFAQFDAYMGQFWAKKIKSKSEKVQVEAAREIQDRVKGKTIQQTVNVEVKPHVEWDLSKPGSIELAERITEDLAKLHGLASGPGDVRESVEMETLPAPEVPQPENPRNGRGH